MMSEWPATSNFFGSLHTSLSRQEVAELYRPHGWSIRQCSWTDYEIRCEFAELVIDSDDPILIHGLVVAIATNVEKLLEPLRCANVPHVVELYGPGHELLHEVKWE
jgi:hypothetical protein